MLDNRRSGWAGEGETPRKQALPWYTLTPDLPAVGRDLLVGNPCVL